MSELHDIDQPCTLSNQFEQNNLNAKWFKKLALPSLIYAVLYTVFTYDNEFGIGILAWIAVTLTYAVYLLRTSDIQLKRGSIFYLVIMGLLGLSTILTTNGWLIWCNYIGFCLLLVYFLLTQTKDASGWSIWDAICGMFFTIIGAFSKLPTPFTDGYSWLRTRDNDDRKHENRRLIFIGTLISIPALLILGSLLMSADAVFGNMLQKLCFDWVFPSNIVGIIFTFLFGLFVSYCGMRYILDRNSERVVQKPGKQPALVAQIFTTAILILYIWFCLVQIVYLFGGFGTLPEGMTYAQYARSGFFQLLFVCMINLILVLVVKQCFETSTYLNRMLFAICLCSYVMTASSAYRMILYIEAYHLTVLRIVVLIALAAIAIILAGVCRHIFSADFRILPYCIVTISVVYILFSLSHVDSFVARYNLAYLTEENATEMFAYLETLSLDAVPVTLHFFENADKDSFNGDEYRDFLIRWLSGYQDVLTDNGPRTWNGSVYRAKCAVRSFNEYPTFR